MPIANANVGNGFRNCISYVYQEHKNLPEKERRVILYENNVAGESSRDIGFQMREIAMERRRVKKPVLHIQISFHPDEKLTKELSKKSVDSILKDIGVQKDNHQYVIVQHRDKEHDHYHVVINRVGMDASLLNDHRILDRLQVACDKTELEYGLRKTEGRTVVFDAENEKGYKYVDRQKRSEKSNSKLVKFADAKVFIKDNLDKALGKTYMNSPEALQIELQTVGIETKFMKNKNGISGVSFRYNDFSIKGSQIDSKWSEIDKRMKENIIKEISNNYKLPNMNKEHENELRQWSEKINQMPINAGTVKEVFNEIKDLRDQTLKSGVVEELRNHINKPVKETEADIKEFKNSQEFHLKYLKASEEIEKMLIKGDTNISVNEVFKKHGFNIDEKNNLASYKGFVQELSPIDKQIRNVDDSKLEYNQKLEEYEKLQNLEYKKIGLFDSSKTKAKKREYNQELENEKKWPEPKFTPKFTELSALKTSENFDLDKRLRSQRVAKEQLKIEINKDRSNTINMVASRNQHNINR